MTEKIKDRLTKLLEAHQLAVKNAPQDQGREREDLEEQIRKHVTGQEATPEPTPWPVVVQTASEAPDPAAARKILEAALEIALMPVKNWYGKPQPKPVLWRDAPGKWKDAVLSAGEVALLSGPGGIGKSYLALAWALGATQNPDAEHGADCGLRVRPGPVVLVSYEDAPVRIAGRIKDRTGGDPAPNHLYVLERPAPLWMITDPGKSGPGDHWYALWKAVTRIKASLVVIDPASAALEGATNDSGPVRRFMDELRVQAEASGAGVLVITHDTKSARNEARGGGDPGAGVVAGSSAWFDASRGVLYLRRNPLEQGEWLLECVKANYGRAGWGAQLKVGKSNGKFCGFVQDEALDRGEVESLKAKRAKPKAQRHGNNKKIPSFLED